MWVTAISRKEVQQWGEIKCKLVWNRHTLHVFSLTILVKLLWAFGKLYWVDLCNELCIFWSSFDTSLGPLFCLIGRTEWGLIKYLTHWFYIMQFLIKVIFSSKVILTSLEVFQMRKKNKKKTIDCKGRGCVESLLVPLVDTRWLPRTY